MDYDFNSIMNYPIDDNDVELKEPWKTMCEESQHCHIGQRKGLSKVDAIRVNKLFGCPLHPATTGDCGVYSGRKVSIVRPFPPRDPEATKEPDIKKDPETTKEPDTKKNPDTTKEPDIKKNPETTKEPDITKDPGTTKEPDTKKDPETTKDPKKEKDTKKKKDPKKCKGLSCTILRTLRWDIA